MPETRYTSPIQRPELVLFYVLDTSGSMRGNPITVLNRAMESTIETMREEAKYNREAHIKIAVLEFNSNCRWVQPRGPEDLEDFKWDDLEAAGTTEVGLALKELNSKLTDRPGGFIDSTNGALMPVIIFMSDGYATNSAYDYKKVLEEVKRNKWFSRATRIGFAIGRDPDIEMIARVAGSGEAVMRTEDLNRFAMMLKWASVTSSMLASETRASSSGHKGAQAMNDAYKRAGEDSSSRGHNVNYEEDPYSGQHWGPDDIFGSNDEFDTDNPF